MTKRNESPARFALIEEVLTDGSKVYGVRFFCDYDPEARVEIDCEDRDKAITLIEALSDGACNIEVRTDCLQT